MKQTRAQSRERPAQASTLVLPTTGGSKKVNVETYFTMMEMLARSKNLTDLLVCWMHRSGYDQLVIELTNGMESGLAYHVTLRSSKETRK